MLYEPRLQRPTMGGAQSYRKAPLRRGRATGSVGLPEWLIGSPRWDIVNRGGFGRSYVYPLHAHFSVCLSFRLPLMLWEIRAFRQISVGTVTQLR